MHFPLLHIHCVYNIQWHIAHCDLILHFHCLVIWKKTTYANILATVIINTHLIITWPAILIQSKQHIYLVIFKYHHQCFIDLYCNCVIMGLTTATVTCTYSIPGDGGIFFTAAQTFIDIIAKKQLDCCNDLLCDFP